MGNYIAGAFVHEAKTVLEPKIDKIKDEFITQQKAAAVRSRLMDLKQAKRRRDTQCAMRVASARDKFYWMLAFYGVMGGLTGIRMLKMKQISPLPLEFIPFALVPTLILNTADMAYGNKFQRINRWSKDILYKEQGWWFNEPVDLPIFLEPHYRALQHDVNTRLQEHGFPPEPDWACFQKKEN